MIEKGVVYDEPKNRVMIKAKENLSFIARGGKN